MIVITKPLGADARHRYMVAQALRHTLRIARTDHIATAHAIAAEWGMAKYMHTPGEIRKIKTLEIQHG